MICKMGMGSIGPFSSRPTVDQQSTICPVYNERELLELMMAPVMISPSYGID